MCCPGYNLPSHCFLLLSVDTQTATLCVRGFVSVANCRVLCVDDHFDTSEMLQMLLSEENYVVHTAATMEEACRMAADSQYDLYVLDKRLPDGTGVELCEKLMTITPGVPCIFYTGDAYEIHRREAMAAGAAAFVAKPDVEGLINAVHQLLANSECATAN
jgi:two-component system OmpR family response regulator